MTKSKLILLAIKGEICQRIRHNDNLARLYVDAGDSNNARAIADELSRLENFIDKEFKEVLND
jgi:hypothetical protein